MERHDPLSQAGEGVSPPPTETPATKPRRAPKQPLLLRQLEAVEDNTLAFLYGGPQQGPGDFERNLARAAELRRDFSAFCQQNPFYANWRQAWAAYMAQSHSQQPAGTVSNVPSDASEWVEFSTEAAPIVTVDFAAPRQACAPMVRPQWQQRLRAGATA